MGLAIVVLAAGLGTRYGGLKQLAPLGPQGEAVLDYTLRDAAAAGFTEAVLVVSDGIVDAMAAHFAEFVPPIPVTFRSQTSAGPARATPWGTAHAVLVGAAGLTAPFAVANADDFYGAAAIAAVADHLRGHDAPDGTATACVVGFEAAATLSTHGGVSRAVCRVDGHDHLLGIEEHTGVRRVDGRLVSDTAALPDDTLVSMNLWGFAPTFPALLEPVVDRFVTEHAGDDHELRLPDVVGELAELGALDVTVLHATSEWFGVTHPEDAHLARDRFAALAVARQFATRSPAVGVVPVEHGHIHDTYIATGPPPEQERIVLQRLNGTVFRDLDALAGNLQRITTHLRAVATRRGTRALVAEPVATLAGGWMHVDATGAAWRAIRYVEGTRVLGSDAPLADLRAAAAAFAELTRDLDDLGPPPLVETIPHFHDFARRRAALAGAIAADGAGRAAGVADLIELASRLSDRLEAELATSAVGSLPRRIVHNDAKLDNVLVDAATGAVACIVDLDTVMAGTVLNDFGELTRTAASGAAEDEIDVTKIALDRDRFAALADGYGAGARSFLTEFERDCLALAGPLLTMENAVRFLTDHLDGDVYFRVHRRDHNAQRARAQLTLAQQMLDRLPELRAVIAAVPA